MARISDKFERTAVSPHIARNEEIDRDGRARFIPRPHPRKTHSPSSRKKTTISLYCQFPLWISPHDHHDGPLFFSSNLLLEFSDGFQCRSSGGVVTTMEKIKKQSTFGKNAKKEEKKEKKRKERRRDKENGRWINCYCLPYYQLTYPATIEPVHWTTYFHPWKRYMNISIRFFRIITPLISHTYIYIQTHEKQVLLNI